MRLSLYCLGGKKPESVGEVPPQRGIGTRAELRSPDPSCNPYLAFSAIIQSGLDG